MLGRIVLVTMSVALAPAVAEATTCSVSATTLDVDIGAGENATLYKRADGWIWVDYYFVPAGSLKCAEALAVDAIVIRGKDGSNERLTIQLEVETAAGFSYWSGAANKSWSVDLGTGYDSVGVRAENQSSAVHWRFGTGSDGADMVDLDDNREADIVALGTDGWYAGGGAGDDRIEGSLKLSGEPVVDLTTSATFDGHGGNDYLLGGTAPDYFYGRDGDDAIYGRGGDDHIEGGEGADYIVGGAGADELDDGTGDDLVLAGPGRDWIEAGFGNDALDGGPGRDTVSYRNRGNFYGGAVIDLASGSGGLSGETDNYTSIQNVIGTYAADTIIGNEDANLLDGLHGADLLRGNGGDDTLKGDLDGDTLEGGSGNDLLDGHYGDDVLRGGLGDDILKGGSDDDVLYGHGGDDVLECGSGTDRWSDPDSVPSVDCEIAVP
jgi:Ca2+-binding RTX toxin-like protein